MLSTPQDSDYLRRRKKRAPVDIKEFLTALHIAKGINEKRLSPYHTAIDITDSTTNVKSNLIDVGYGASQILPVAMACRSWSPAPLLIEQPEIHLHPRAQGEVADLLLNTARDRQVFIETHSVHLINRARLRVAEGSLKPSDVVVIYVDRNRRGSHAKAITIAPSGEFERDWPEGFFEERYQETLALIDAKAKRKDS